MKKPIMIIAALMLLVMPMMAERVTPETARKVATTFLQNNGAKTTQMAELSKSVGFDNLYIFTTESSFVVMSADDCVKPILGYSFDGKFEVEGMPENVRGWLKGYNEEIAFAVQNDMKATSETALLWKDFVEGNTKAGKAIVAVNPLIQTKWNQNKYYNNLCPSVSDGPNGHAFTGCVATAMAQIMKYWEYPSHGIGSNSYTWKGQTLSANFGETTYDWDNMVNQYEYYYVNGNDQYAQWIGEDTPERIAAVATLMYHCGVSVEMIYGGSSTGGSSASTAHVADALKNYFNYSSDIVYREKSDYSDVVWKTMVKSELNESRPLQYRGSSNGGGHSFICDGYNDNDYFHFNWGWSGAYNGYFSLDNLNTGANNQSGQGNGVYTNDQAALFGIQPSQCLSEVPTNLTYTLSGLQDITLNWATANGANSYNIYRNGNLVGNTTTTTFTETAPFGTNVYWVRSMDTNGKLSLSSNTVSITIEFKIPVVNDLEATLLGNEATLSWTAPEWCYPETPSSTMTYGTQSNSGAYFSFGTNQIYWGHRYLPENISAYSGMRLYSVEFYTHNTGTYELCIYTGSTTNNSQARPITLVYNQSILATVAGWNTFDLAIPYIIDGNQDTWIMMHNTEVFNNLQVYLCTAEGDNGVYYSTNPLSYTYNNASGSAFLIKAYLTDDTYTYNLYQDGTRIANNLTDTSYSGITLNDNAANQFVVKTNYYGGESPASNMAGFTLGSASIASMELGSNDKMTLTQNSKLTVSGDLINTNPDNLILEDGAQLIHNSDDVAATVKKDIAPYTANDYGWYFIASPVTETITPSEENGFLNGTVGQDNNTYDFYYYYEPEYLWKNYEAEAFNIIHKQGYLYANGETEGTTLQFAGTLIPSNNSVTVNNLSHSAAILNGFNLVGNPFVCNATVNMDFYVIDNTTNDIVLPPQNTVIAPCEGVFVQASAENTSVTFSKANAAKSNNPKDCFDIIVSQNKANLDRARVRFGEGTGMEKYSLDDKHTQISLWQDGLSYAVAYLNGDDEMPLNFKAKKNGTYTLSIETQDLDLSYLHLIDNLTGDDVDLLATPSYPFKATTNDYISRFKLVFNNGTTTASEAFAFIGNGNIIISHEGKGDLQIVDMIGRIIASYDGHIQCVPTSGMAPGVYVLRLIDNENVKTQKIVIE